MNASHMGLSAYPRTDYIMSKWKIEFIEDKEGLDGLDVLDSCMYATEHASYLCSIVDQTALTLAKTRYHHQDPPSPIQTTLSSGLRSNTFLYADEHASTSLNYTPAEAAQTGINSESNMTHPISGYIDVLDASYNICNTYPHDFKGELKVHPAHIATTFFQKLMPREEKGASKGGRTERRRVEGGHDGLVSDV